MQHLSSALEKHQSWHSLSFKHRVHLVGMSTHSNPSIAVHHVAHKHRALSLANSRVHKGLCLCAIRTPVLSSSWIAASSDIDDLVAIALGALFPLCNHLCRLFKCSYVSHYYNIIIMNDEQQDY